MLADAKVRLARYEKILGVDLGEGNGNGGDGGEEMRKMAKRLEEKEEELRIAELKLRENEMVRLLSLFSSLDPLTWRISAGWGRRKSLLSVELGPDALTCFPFFVSSD